MKKLTKKVDSTSKPVGDSITDDTKAVKKLGIKKEVKPEPEMENTEDYNEFSEPTEVENPTETLEDVLSKASTFDIGKASSESLEYAVALMARKFDIKEGFVVTRWADGANVCAITLSSIDFDLTIKVKNKFENGFPEIKKERAK